MNTSSLLFLISLLFFPFSLDKKPNSSLEKAEEAYHFEAYNLAIKYYKNYFKKHSSCHPSFSKVAFSYWEIDRPKECIEWYKRSTNCQVLTEPHLLAFAKSLIRDGQYEYAKSVLSSYKYYNRYLGEALIQKCEFAQTHIGEKSHFTTIQLEESELGQRQEDFNFPAYVCTSFSGKTPEKITNHFLTVASEERIYDLLSEMESDLQMEQLILEGLDFNPADKTVLFTVSTSLNTKRPISEIDKPLFLLLADVTSIGLWDNIRLFPHQDKSYSTAYGSFSNDGNTIYFASNRPNGIGGFDIYTSEKIDSLWTVPVNLGNFVNSIGNEISPFQSQDTSLYFSSDFYKGLGGFDIYKMNYQNKEWQDIIHLGSKVNSAADDYGFVFNANSKEGFFMNSNSGFYLERASYSCQQVTKPDVIIKTKIYAKKDTQEQVHFTIAETEEKDTIPATKITDVPANKTVSFTLAKSEPLTERKNSRLAELATAEKKTTVDYQPAPEVVRQPKPINVSSSFKVRLGSFTEPTHFPFDLAEQMGTIESYDWNEYTIYFLDGFHSRTDAEYALQEAKTVFTNATLVQKVNGRYRSVR